MSGGVIALPARLRALLVMSVERTQNADAGEHRRTTEIGNQHQRLDRGLPFRRIMLALRQLRDEAARVSEGDDPSKAYRRHRKISHAQRNQFSANTVVLCGAMEGPSP